MKKVIVIAGIMLGFGGSVSAHEVVRQESKGEWTSYRILCDSGKTRYITENETGYWSRGKNYGDQSRAVEAACKA